MADASKPQPALAGFGLCARCLERRAEAARNTLNRQAMPPEAARARR